MYQAVMGEAFDRLNAPVQRFHRFAGWHEFEGRVEVLAPASNLAALLALCLGTPLKDASGSIRFELDAKPDAEVWIRKFPDKTMHSKLTRSGDRIVETLGAARLTFELLEAGGALEMRLERLHFLGILCPSWLMPQVVARETGEAGNLHFRVLATVPLAGTVASYSGYLGIPPEEVS
jgi:Domain of unknown function (DUF4166)